MAHDAGRMILPPTLSLPSEDVLTSEGLTSASIDETAGPEQPVTITVPVGKLPAFGASQSFHERHPSAPDITTESLPLPDGQLEAQGTSPEPPADSKSPQPVPDAALSGAADPLGATVNVGRRAGDGSPDKTGFPSPRNTAGNARQQMPGSSPGRRGAGSSPARQLPALDASSAPAALVPAQEPHAAQPLVQPVQIGSVGGSRESEARAQPGDKALQGSGSSGPAGDAAVRDNSASAGIRLLTREISELAYMDCDPIYGSPVRRYRGTDDAEERFASTVAPDSSRPSTPEGLQEGSDVMSGPSQQQQDERESEHLGDPSTREQDPAALEQGRSDTGKPLLQEPLDL